MSDVKLATKRLKAMALLNEYAEWYLRDQRADMGVEVQLVYTSLTRDILQDDTYGLDLLIATLTAKNNNALMRKLSKNIPV